MSLNIHAAAELVHDTSKDIWSLRTAVSKEELALYDTFKDWSADVSPYLSAIEAGDRKVINTVWHTLRNKVDAQQEKLAFLLRSLTTRLIANSCILIAFQYRDKTLPEDISPDPSREHYWLNQALLDDAPEGRAAKASAEMLLGKRPDPGKDYGDGAEK